MYAAHHARPEAPAVRIRRRALTITAVVLAMAGGGVAYAATTGNALTCTTTAAQNTDGSVDVASHCVGLVAPPTTPPTTPPATTAPATTPPATTPPATTAPATTPPATTPPATTPPATLTGCAAHPAACGFPDATTTGAHGTLPAYTGSLTIATANTTVHDVTITGCPVITAQGTTFRNVLIRCNARQSYVVETEGSADLGGQTTMDHVTVVCGTGMHGGTAFGDHFLMITAADISGCENGGDADAGEQFTIAESYIHGMFLGDSVAPEPHTDGIQVWPNASRIVFTHNTVLMAGANSTFTNGGGGNFTVTRNLLIGGNFEVYWIDGGGTFAGNRLGDVGPNHGHNGVSPFGYCDGCNSTASGNVLDSDGSALSLAQLNA